MRTSRLEAFSDGVMAIIITIMVLELKVPEGHDLAALTPAVGSSLLTYLLSFVYVGIYWNNHHHLFQATETITGGVLWANLHLLFWLSLFPFNTAWMDESGLAQTPVVAYGLNLLAAAIAYLLMQAVIIRGQGPDSALRRAMGKDVKGKASLALYLAGVLSAFLGGAHQAVWSYLGVAFFVVAAILWLVPDRRIERNIGAEPKTG